MRDPFEVLRAELLGAAESRAPMPVAKHRWGWLRRRSHPASIVFAALVVCGSAAAGVVSLASSSSQPLAGRVPGRGEPASVAGYRYAIIVTPMLDAGSAGWASGISYTRGRATGSGSSGGGGYPTLAGPLFGGSSIGFTVGVGHGPTGDSVGFVLAGPGVAAVRFGSRTIRTFTSARLPAGVRAAVFFVPAGSPQPLVGWRSGDPITSSLPIPPITGYRGPREIRLLAVLPLDGQGRLLASRPSYPISSFSQFWQAPSAVTPSIDEPPYHGPTRPRPGVCELAQHGLPALVPEWGHTIGKIWPASDANSAVFLSCVDTEYYLHGWPLVVAVLLDGRRPGRVLGPIPGAAPVAGHADTVDLAGGSLSARRIGNAWLVVQGGSRLAQRLQVLAALRIGTLDLSHIGRGVAPH